MDIEALQQALPLFKDLDYIDGSGENGLIKGTGFELVKLAAIRSIISHKRDHLEHVTLALREKIGRESLFIELPTKSHPNYQKEIFITCDYPEDLELLRKIFKEYNYSFEMPISSIIDLYRRKPNIFKLNKHLHYN